MKTWIARKLRAAAETTWMPMWAARACHRLAFAVRPHELRCKLCGRVFTQERYGSFRHADAAWQHWVDVHEHEGTDRENGSTER